MPIVLAHPPFLLLQGYATDAWDFLSTQQFSTAAAEAQQRALMGGIRAEAWMQVGSRGAVLSAVLSACS